MTEQAKRPTLLDIEKLPTFFQEEFSKWNDENHGKTTPEEVNRQITILCAANELAQGALKNKTSIGHAFSVARSHLKTFPSVQFTTPHDLAVAYYKADAYLKTLTPSQQKETLKPTNSPIADLIKARSSSKAI